MKEGIWEDTKQRKSNNNASLGLFSHWNMARTLAPRPLFHHIECDILGV